jgi:uncharacterized protein YndB with AHSA1/START domain
LVATRPPRFRPSGGERGATSSHGIIRIEPHIGGRLFESYQADGETRLFEVGTVRIWEPPKRLGFSWRNANFAPHENTEVEVTFEPTPGGTAVTVTHRGWSALRPDHPARHGLEPAGFVRMIGMWWADQLQSLRQLADQTQ